MVVIFYRLNPKPDPRYEKLFQETEAYESKSINPNDLRHNLMKRKHDDDDDSYDARYSKQNHPLSVKKCFTILLSNFQSQNLLCKHLVKDNQV